MTRPLAMVGNPNRLSNFSPEPVPPQYLNHIESSVDVNDITGELLHLRSSSWGVPPMKNLRISSVGQWLVALHVGTSSLGAASHSIGHSITWTITAYGLGAASH